MTGSTPRSAELSLEVQWYLSERGIPIPDCPPLWRTPEPVKVPGAQFDPERVDRVLQSFGALRHTQGQWAGQPLKPDPWQVAYILAPVFGWVRWDDEAGGYVRIISELYVELPRKNGKLLAHSTVVPTPAGLVKHGDLQVGDLVYGIDGQPCRVSAVSEDGIADHLVTLVDGQSFVAHAAHEWDVYDPSLGGSRRYETAALAARSDWLRDRGQRLSVRCPSPVVGVPQAFEVDPYLIGLWVGDGASASARVTIGPEDLETMRAIIGRCGGVILPAPTMSYTLNVPGGRPRRNGRSNALLDSLDRLRLRNAKHIPDEILTASVDQRLGFLQGLMDADGTVDGGTYPSPSLTTTSPVIAEQFPTLARSLGFKVRKPHRSIARLDGRAIGPKWTIYFTGPLPAFRLPRKLARVRASNRRSTQIAIESVAPTTPEPGRCIEVDCSDGQYLIGDYVPTHNSTLAGGIALYLTGGDGEQGAQVLAAATTEGQAGFVFQPIKKLAESEPQLKNHFRPYQKKILHPRTGSYFQVVSKVADAQHGGNIHGAIIDELHVHKTPDLVDIIESGTGSRSQPLVCTITTADDGRLGTIYDRKRRRVEELASGVIHEETVYGVVWAAGENDDPFVEATHRKANPGFGISPKRSYLARKANAARQSPAELASFLRLHLGIRTKQQTKYIELPVWDRNSSLVVEEKLHGKQCYGGLDLASVSDLCALAWDFPDGDGGHDVVWRLWMPEAALESLDRRTAGSASVWERRGFLTLTPGEVVDYDFIRAQINVDRESFAVKEIGFDPWNSTQLVTDLGNDGAEMVAVRQGFATLASPTKELLRLLLEGTSEKPRYRHGGNPAMRWQIDNFAVAMDAAGNVKPDRAAVAAAGAKMDGVVAGIMALSRAVAHEKPRKSAYEDRGLGVVG